MCKDQDDYFDSDEERSESDKPLPARHLVPAERAIEGVSQPEEDMGGNPDLLTPSGEVTASTVSRFMTFYPFTRFFCWVAYKQFPSSIPPETRVHRLRQQHRFFYTSCLLFDFLFVLLATLLLLLAAAVVLYKTIWLGIA
jgi:hypothetical protein